MNVKLTCPCGYESQVHEAPDDKKDFVEAREAACPTCGNQNLEVIEV